jgi:hypothetical protein
MKIKDLCEGMIFEIYNDDNAEPTTTIGKITSIWSLRASDAWGIQFDDELGTFTWGRDEDIFPSDSYTYLGMHNDNEFRR